MESIIQTLTMRIAECLRSRRQMVCCAESCTGGLIAKTLTDLAGSSDWFERGFVTYSNAAKMELLNVREQTLQTFGAVSEEVAREMVEGALDNSRAHAAIAVTGIAGPGGGSALKPVGTVWFGFVVDGSLLTQRRVFAGNRPEVRDASLLFALTTLADLLQS